MFSSRFFRRIFLPYLILICVATTAVGVFAAMRLRDSYLAAANSKLHNESVLLSQLLGPDLAAGGPGDAAVERQARQTGDALHCRVTIIDEDGRVLGDNEADPAGMQNHLDRPEIAQARAEGDGSAIRYSQTLNADLLYVAHHFVAPNGRAFYVRIAVHLTDLQRELRFVYGAMALVVLIAASAGALLSFYVARRSAAPVMELSDFARALARGELNRRLLPSENGEIGHLAGALNTMADSLGRLLAQTNKDRAELLAMLTSMSEGVIATDTKQRIVLVNDRAAEMFAFPTVAAQGKALWEVVRNESILKAAPEVLASRERRAFQVSPAAGQYLEITACPYPAEGIPEGLILVAHDTTQSVRYQELRKEFVANVSHELRTPLTVIKGFTETLRDGAIGDPVTGPRFLATIEKHVDQLTNLVSDLLELSKLEATPDLPRRVSFDLCAVVRRAADLLLPAAQRKDQALDVELPRGLPRLQGNPDYVERAVSNLIDNSIKYTPEHGKVRVTAGVEQDWLYVEVCDNGIGIPPEDLSRVFERFYRVDRSRSREMGGTGLGLSIVKHVVQVHGGAVDVTSTPGKGSKFRMKLPIPIDE